MTNYKYLESKYVPKQLATRRSQAFFFFSPLSLSCCHALSPPVLRSLRHSVHDEGTTTTTVLWPWVIFPSPPRSTGPQSSGSASRPSRRSGAAPGSGVSPPGSRIPLTDSASRRLVKPARPPPSPLSATARQGDHTFTLASKRLRGLGSKSKTD